MPIYEYECGSCHHRYEQMVRIGAEAPPCPQCSSAEVRKLVSQSAFILKGGGWYKDHYGLKKDGASSPSSSSGEGKGPDAGSSKKAESPAAAAAAPSSTPAAAAPAKA